IISEGNLVSKTDVRAPARETATTVSAGVLQVVHYSHPNNLYFQSCHHFSHPYPLPPLALSLAYRQRNGNSSSDRSESSQFATNDGPSHCGGQLRHPIQCPQNQI